MHVCMYIYFVVKPKSPLVFWDRRINSVLRNDEKNSLFKNLRSRLEGWQGMQLRPSVVDGE